MSKPDLKFTLCVEPLGVHMKPLTREFFVSAEELEGLSETERAELLDEKALEELPNVVTWYIEEADA